MDADARRSRAIARLARWADRTKRWAWAGPYPIPNPFVVFAGRRAAAWRRAVERCAAADVLAGYDIATVVVPTRFLADDDDRLVIYNAALAFYYRAAGGVADYLAAGRRTGAAVQTAGPRRPLRRDQPGR